MVERHTPDTESGSPDSALDQTDVFLPSDEQLSGIGADVNRMGNKNKTISFRVNEDAFEALRGIAEERDISLSAVFRDYVDLLVSHDGQVQVVPEHEAIHSNDDTFPPMVEVPKGFLREHERLELEAKHLREQLDEHKRYVTQLRKQIEDSDEDEVVHLEDIDRENGKTDSSELDDYPESSNFR